MDDNRLQELLARLRPGDETAWADLYLAARPHLTRFLRFYFPGLAAREEVDDAIQNTIVALMRNLGYSGCGARRSVNWSYILTIVYRQACSIVLHHGRSSSETGDDEDVEDPNTPRPEEIAEHWAEIERVRAAIDELTDPEKQLLMLKYEQGMSWADIARELQKNENTVRSRALRLRRRLADTLGRDLMPDSDDEQTPVVKPVPQSAGDQP